MSVNQMSFEQSANLLNLIAGQVTGKTGITPQNEADFVSVATTTLQAGYDPVINSITQLVGRTVYSNRPYRRRFRGIQVDNQKFGAITRKLQIIDKDWEQSAQFNLVDGQSIDMYTVNKPEVLQTNFYGANHVQRHYTIFKDQLDSAFHSSAEFGQFLAMVTQNNLDVIEQNRESVARAIIANFVGGKLAEDTASVIHLLTEYNTATGGTFTKIDIMKPENYPAFIKWVYGRVEQLSDMMTERSQKFQINVAGKEVNRHTPRGDQRVYLNSQALAEITSRVLTDTYHDNFLTFAETEGVNFWQAIDSPYSLSVTPSVLDKTNGSIKTGQAQTTDSLFGVIFDRDALGMTIINEEASTTPYNARGKYWNQWFTYTTRWWNDFTEKGIVLLLD